MKLDRINKYIQRLSYVTTIHIRKSSMELTRFYRKILLVTSRCTTVFTRNSSSLSEHKIKCTSSDDKNLDWLHAPEDLSGVTPYYQKTFNLAAYVNNSEFLQNLIHLNVNLAKLEKHPRIVDKLLKLNFKEIKNHILFINDYVGEEEIGNYLTKNPMILCEPLNDLEVRINYLQSKHFSKKQTKTIVSRNPFWLMFR